MRVKNAVARRKRRKKWLKLAKGFKGAAGRRYRVAREYVMHALWYSYRDRRQRKRDFRRLWIARINAFVRGKGMRYSEFINGLKKANIKLDRKMLAELSLSDPEVMERIVEIAKTASTKVK